MIYFYSLDKEYMQRIEKMINIESKKAYAIYKETNLTPSEYFEKILKLVTKDLKYLKFYGKRGVKNELHLEQILC